MVKALSSDAPASHTSVGKWITRCGPKGKKTIFSIVTLTFFVLIGLLALVSSLVLPVKPGEEDIATGFGVVGFVVIISAILCFWLAIRGKNEQVDLYSNGLRHRKKGVEHYAAWSQIQKTIITTVYDTRFSNYRMVQLTLADGTDLFIQSRLDGNPDLVIDSILANAPNVEEKVLDMGA